MQKEKKTSKKAVREDRVLLALVEYYIKTGKPVGSATLQEYECQQLSSATIRNYFATLEKKGYLHQQHTSGGRVPTPLAYKFFANHLLEKREFSSVPFEFSFEQQNQQHIALCLQKIGQYISEASGCAVFISSPRFDNDHVIDAKLILLDNGRCLSVILTQFGLVYTEVLQLPDTFAIGNFKLLSDYFCAKVTQKVTKKEMASKEEVLLGNRLYQEAMARYFVSYANFSQEDMYKTGFSQMFRYPEFQEAQALTSSLLLFENTQALRALCQNSAKAQEINFWIGKDLEPFLHAIPNCAVITINYSIAQKVAGAVGLITPMRIEYGKIFSQLVQAEEEISSFLTNALYKYKVTYRSPKVSLQELDIAQKHLLSEKKELQS